MNTRPAASLDSNFHLPAIFPMNIVMRWLFGIGLLDLDSFHSFEGKEPMSYTHGSGQIIPGLATEIEGMNEGEEKSIAVSAQNAYGEANPEAFKELPKSSLPEGLTPQKEMMLQISTPEGQTIPARISEVKEESIVIDMNHPLAGKDLAFDVQLIEISESS